MANIEMLWPYVEQKVAEALGLEKVTKDADGDIPVRTGSAVSFVRLLEGPNGRPLLRVFAPLVRNVKSSPALLERLNELNASAPYVRFFWHQDQVLCSLDVFAENLQREEIENALGAVSWHADNLDDTLKGEFGGERMIEEEPGGKVSPPPEGYL